MNIVYFKVYSNLIYMRALHPFCIPFVSRLPKKKARDTKRRRKVQKEGERYKKKARDTKRRRKVQKKVRNTERRREIQKEGERYKKKARDTKRRREIQKESEI